MPAKRSRSRVDDEIVAMIRQAMEAKGWMQKDLAGATGMTQPQISVRLSYTGASIPVHQVVLMCGALGMDVTKVFDAAQERAERSPQGFLAETLSKSPSHPSREVDDSGQVEAVGRQIAASLWAGCDDLDFIVLAIDQYTFREDSKFWTQGRKQLALMFALHDLAYTIGQRYPIRDRFTLKPVMEPEKIIR